MSDELKIEPIGVIETPFREPAGTPIQPSRAKGARGKVRVELQFHAGLKDLAGFERIWLIYWLHKAPVASLLVTPFLDRRQRGVFATRAPARPSPLGISAVRLLAVQEGVLEVADVDMIDGTPLLDSSLMFRSSTAMRTAGPDGSTSPIQNAVWRTTGLTARHPERVRSNAEGLT